MPKQYTCKKCLKHGPGEPCVITMDEHAMEPTLCPSDNGPDPSAEWKFESHKQKPKGASPCHS
ncbi:MAG: hypothetical protein HKM93_01170 [Desulfobacteraceae bacterium]|nr:hypothetical protein [Desulfobacteraceae bacterium]